MATTREPVRIPAKRYEDEDDCLAAAEWDYQRTHDLVGWDLSPRWEDNERDVILLDVPTRTSPRNSYGVTEEMLGDAATLRAEP